jgi:hypothetical protein
LPGNRSPGVTKELIVTSWHIRLAGDCPESLTVNNRAKVNVNIFFIFRNYSELGQYMPDNKVMN